MDLLLITIIFLILIVIVIYVSKQIADMKLELIATQQKCLTYVEKQKDIIMKDNKAQIRNEIFTKIKNKIECEVPENITFIKKLRVEYEEYKNEMTDTLRAHRGNVRESIQKTRTDLGLDINIVHKFAKEKTQDAVWKIDQNERKINKTITSIQAEKASMEELEKLCAELDVTFKKINAKFDEITTLINSQSDKKDQKPKKPKYENVVDEEIIREYDDDIIEPDGEEGMIRDLEDYDNDEENEEPEEDILEVPEETDNPDDSDDSDNQEESEESKEEIEDELEEPEESEEKIEENEEPEEKPTDFTGENQPFIEDDDNSPYDLEENDEEDFFN